jgi:hypothetical protein
MKKIRAKIRKVFFVIITILALFGVICAEIPAWSVFCGFHTASELYGPAGDNGKNTGGFSKEVSFLIEGFNTVINSMLSEHKSNSQKRYVSYFYDKYRISPGLSRCPLFGPSRGYFVYKTKKMRFQRAALAYSDEYPGFLTGNIKV